MTKTGGQTSATGTTAATPATAVKPAGRGRARAAGAANHTRAANTTDAKPAANGNVSIAAPAGARVTPATKLVAPPRLPPPKTVAEAYTRALASPPSRMRETWPQTGGVARTALAIEQATFYAGLPKFSARLDGKAPPPRTRIGAPDAPAARTAPVARLEPVVAPPTPAVTPTTINDAYAHQCTVLFQQDPTRFHQVARQSLGKLNTQDDVDTSGEPREALDVSKPNDPDNPERGRTAQRQTDATITLITGLAEAQVLMNPGAQHIQPITKDDPIQVKRAATPALDGLVPAPETASLTRWGLMPKELDAFDAVAEPMMTAHLAEANAQFQRSDDDRRAEQQRATRDVEVQVAKANEHGNLAQQKLVTDARREIVDDQQATLDAQHQAMTDAQADAALRTKTQVGIAETQINATRAEINAKYEAGHKEAVDRQKEGEKKAEDAKLAAEQDTSIWDDIVSVAKDAFDAVVDAVKSAVNWVKDRIHDIFDLIKKAVVGLINLARDVINGALDLLDHGLKFVVDHTVGVVFPDLAKKLDDKIDGTIKDAKDAVNAAADRLIKDVTEAIDRLEHAIDKYLDKFVAAVEFARDLAVAALRGDWAEVARLVINGILGLLDINPADFWAFVAKVKGTISTILDDPGAFVGHLVDAVSAGFQGFSDRFLTYVTAAIFDWLFGEMAGAGITIPTRFDLAGLFDLAMQIFGLTVDNVRALAIETIGPDNVARFDKVWHVVSTLVTGGWSGLWDEIVEFLGQLQGLVVDALEDWLLKTIAEQAAIHLAVLFAPGGALLELVRTIWKVATWLYENAQRIKTLLVAIVDSLADIATGKIDAAAKWIEHALGELTKVAINLIINLLGLGGISETIRKIVGRAREVVHDAIVSVIKKIAGRFGGGKDKKAEPPADDQAHGKKADAAKTDPAKADAAKADAAKADAVASFGDPIVFAGGAHRLWVELHGTRADVMIASVPEAIEQWLAELKARPLGKENAAKAPTLFKEARARATTIERDAVSAQKSKVPGEERTLTHVIEDLAKLYDVQPVVALEIKPATLTIPLAPNLLADFDTQHTNTIFNSRRSAATALAAAKKGLRPDGTLVLPAAPSDLSSQTKVKRLANQLIKETGVASVTLRLDGSRVAFDAAIDAAVARNVVTGDIGGANRSVFGAVRAGESFKGSFDPSKRQGDPKTSWNWDGYPSGTTITRHPANDFLKYRNAGNLGDLKPRAGDGVEPGLSYTYIGGKTPGGSDVDKESWIRVIKDRVDNRTAEILQPTVTPTDAQALAAEQRAQQDVLDEDLRKYPGLSWDDYLLGFERQWQAHHVWEHSWGGGEDKKNFQYLLRMNDHQSFSTWWNNRAGDIKKGLGTK